jgi:hypothetical protein
MPAKKNPLNLNPLQLKTLTLLQALAKLQGQAGDEQGGLVIEDLPRPHGDHFHLGDAMVAARDATGLGNEAVWIALERKGLIRSGFPDRAMVTAAGIAYETGIADAILHRAEH